MQEEAMDAWLSQFMLEQECAAMSSLHQHQHQQYYDRGDGLDSAGQPPRGFEETKDEDDYRPSPPPPQQQSYASAAATGPLGYHKGYEIAEAKYVDFDRRVRSAVAAQPNRPTSGGDVLVKAAFPPPPVLPLRSEGRETSYSGPTDYRGFRAQHWRERRARARSGGHSSSGGGGPIASKVKHPIVAQAGLLSAASNSKREASMKRSRTNGKFTKCKISWVSISELENQNRPSCDMAKKPETFP
jgi:hypothetical protein